MPQLVDIVRLHGRTYLQRFQGRILPSHRKALRDIAACRTAKLGGHLAKCDTCSKKHHYYHSCTNRSCPKCHRTKTETWFEKQKDSLLPVPYFHVVFTLPQELRRLIRKHQKVLLPLMFKAAAHSLMALAMDPHYVGGKIGLIAVLHTWSQTLIWHPHIHCLVPGIGICTDGSFRKSRGSYLVPVQALSVGYRGRFLAAIRCALPGESIPESVRHMRWCVYSKSTIKYKSDVLNYLARYVHRIAITNSRIIAVDENSVTFRYRDNHDNRLKTMTLHPHEFLRRFFLNMYHLPNCTKSATTVYSVLHIKIAFAN